MKQVLLAVFLLPIASYATEIVAIRAPSFVLLAADSKPTWGGTPGPSRVCKIYLKGTLFFAVAGLEHDTARGFYVKNLVNVNGQLSDSFHDRVNRSVALISSAFVTEMTALKREDPTNYKLASQNAEAQLSLVFAQAERGIPYLSVRSFTYHDSPKPAVDLVDVDCPGKDCPDGNILETSGKVGDVEAYRAAHGNAHIDPVDLARSLIEKGVQEQPDYIGLPIDILRLDASGPTWIANNDNCPVSVQ